MDKKDRMTGNFKKGESANDYCRECKGLMFEDEDDFTICYNCIINMIKGRRKRE